MMCLNKIRNESCIATMNQMPDCFVDLVITSPPYDEMREYEGNTSIEFETIATELHRILKTGGVIVWVVGDETKNGAGRHNVRELDTIDQMAFLAKGMVGKSLPYKVLVNRKPN